MSDTFERKDDDGADETSTEAAVEAGAEETVADKEQALLEVDRSTIDDLGRRSSLFEDPLDPARLDELGVRPDELLGAEAMAPNLDGRLDPLGLGVENSVGGLPDGFGGAPGGPGLDMDLPGGVGQAGPGVTGAQTGDGTMSFDLAGAATQFSPFSPSTTNAIITGTGIAAQVGEFVIEETVEGVGMLVDGVAAVGTWAWDEYNADDAASGSALAGARTASAAASSAEAVGAAAEAGIAGAVKPEGSTAQVPEPVTDPETQNITTADDAGGGDLSLGEALHRQRIDNDSVRTPDTGTEDGGDVTTDTEGDLIFIKGGDGGFTDPLEEQVDVALFQPEIRDDFNHAGPEYGPTDDGVNTAGSSDFEG